MRVRELALCPFLCVSVLFVVFCPARPLGAAPNPEILNLQRYPSVVPQNGRVEIQFDLRAAYANPFDPDEIDVQGEIITPTGRTFTIPGFYDQPYRTEVHAPSLRRRNVRLMKFYISPGKWNVRKPARIWIDDIVLLNTKTGKKKVVADFEDNRLRIFGCKAHRQKGHAKSGSFALAGKFPVSAKGWPGVHVELPKENWANFDALEFWVKIAAPKSAGWLFVEFYSDQYKNQKGFAIGKDITPNKWTRVRWTFDNRPTVKLVKDGAPSWKVHLLATELGQYTARIRVRDLLGETLSSPISFHCCRSNWAGVVRKKNDRYFGFPTGKTWFAIGHNVCWWGPGKTLEYESYFKRMAEHGENYARVWMSPWAFGIETLGGRLTEYRMDQAWALDRIFDLARENRVHILLCLEWHGMLDQWSRNPYSATMGGPCNSVDEFWTNRDAREAFKKRLRYIVARYGWNTNLLAWELWNEVDIAGEDYNAQLVKKWHKEMARYLKKIDPWHHMVTTSYARNEGDAEIWRLPEIDFTQTHVYGAPDVAEAILRWAKDQERYGKPHFVGEFGLGGTTKEAEVDPKGVYLHNGIWAATMAGDAGTAMTWWWDSYVDPLNLYTIFDGLVRFLSDEDLNAYPRALDVLSVHYAPDVSRQPVGLVYAPTCASWEPAPFNRETTVVITPDGPDPPCSKVSKILHGIRNHPDLHNPINFHVNMPKEGKFSVYVKGVSGYGGAALTISLDGKKVLNEMFRDPDGEKDTTTLECYNGSYSIPVPAGQHVIRVENNGKDWAEVGYGLTNAYVPESPQVRVVGRAGDDRAIAWVQNMRHTWSRTSLHEPQYEEHGVVVRLGGLRQGMYSIETWDTTTGKNIATQEHACVDGVLELTLGNLSSDIALKIRRIVP